MAKVSIALRGWRFDEETVFDDSGELRPIDEMEQDTRERLVRLAVITGNPCDACWLIHGDENIEQCKVARVVYGEPLHEVVVCDRHEADFLYWFREEGGAAHADEPSEFDEAFYDWFEAGNRAPDGYGGLEHVDTDPDAVPDHSGTVEMPSLEEELERMDDEELDALGVDLSDLDIDLDSEEVDDLDV
ncbi:hypothetical protein [Halorarius halobius]|uniref:hypothetical protein n=1 Tax=Halorarius halobius TaxID=2962671 RepID=UPI0020CBB8AD|nr:hypothetical protein [Halorarius halobius]